MTQGHPPGVSTTYSQFGPSVSTSILKNASQTWRQANLIWAILHLRSPFLRSVSSGQLKLTMTHVWGNPGTSRIWYCLRLRSSTGGAGLGMCSMWSKGDYCINHTFLLYGLNLLTAENTETIFSCGIKNKQTTTNLNKAQGRS